MRQPACLAGRRSCVTVGVRGDARDARQKTISCIVAAVPCRRSPPTDDDTRVAD
jgi:hypothetical protein